MKREKDVIVFLETSGEKREEINRGLIAEGRRIAALLEGGLGALIVGSPSDDPRTLEQSGVSDVYLVEGEDLSRYSGEVYARAARAALENVPFRLLLFAHTDRGSELAPRIASYLGTAAVSDCVDVRVRDGSLFYVRPVYAGQLEQEVSFAGPFPEIASIRPDSLQEREIRTCVPLRIHHIPVAIPPHTVRTESLEVISPDYRTVDILYAQRIIGAGTGCADPALLGLVEELSRLLEGSIGTTRPVVDDGLQPKDRMIGQTGKTVSPDLYLALGISGSPHHVAGIGQSRKILSVNRDPRAPIFNVADEGFVCDLRTLLPKLINRIERYKNEGSP